MYRLSTDVCPGPEVSDILAHTFHLPTNGHRCMLRESKFNQSEDSLNDAVGAASPRPLPSQRPAQSQPLVITKEISSAMNAIKYICHQMRNTEEFEEVGAIWAKAEAFKFMLVRKFG